MPRYNVELDGEWACFSGVVDAFVTPFVPLGDYERWRRDEYGKSCGPLERANRMTLRKAMVRLSTNKSDAEILQNLRDAGLIPEKETSNETD